MNIEATTTAETTLILRFQEHELHTFNCALETARTYGHDNSPPDRIAGRILDVTAPLSGGRKRVSP